MWKLANFSTDCRGTGTPCTNLQATSRACTKAGWEFHSLKDVQGDIQSDPGGIDNINERYCDDEVK